MVDVTFHIGLTPCAISFSFLFSPLLFFSFSSIVSSSFSLLSVGRDATLTISLSLSPPWALADWFPKMCSCLDSSATLSSSRSSGRTGSYERLGSDLTIFDPDNMVQETRGTRRQRRNDSEDLAESERVRIPTYLNHFI